MPDEDPAGHAPKGSGGERFRAASEGTLPAGEGEESRAPLIYCGQCGGLNPAGNHYCAACGATLVDAFHASEGLRVYSQPDTASRLVEIVPAGSELDVVEDPDAPDDFVRVKLAFGRLGYIRLHDVAALANAPRAAPAMDAPDINTAARGCVSQTGALGALVLMIVLSTLVWLYIARSDSSESGIMALAACVTLGPLLAITIGLFIFARSRDERLEWEAAERAESAAGPRDGD